MATFKGLASERMPASISVGKLHPPILQQLASWRTPCSIVFHESVVSGRDTFREISLISALRADLELIESLMFGKLGIMVWLRVIDLCADVVKRRGVDVDRGNRPEFQSLSFRSRKGLTL